MAIYSFESEHRNFLQLLLKHQVDYMLIGGVVVNLYGYIRGTGDLDILFNPSDQNKIRLVQVIEEFGYDATEFGQKDVSEILMFTLGARTFQGHIELTNRIAGINYDEASLRKQQTLVDGVMISYLHYDDLLKNKQASGRQKDLLDIEKLMQIRRAENQTTTSLLNVNKKQKSSFWQRAKQWIQSLTRKRT